MSVKPTIPRIKARRGAPKHRTALAVALLLLSFGAWGTKLLEVLRQPTVPAVAPSVKPVTVKASPQAAIAKPVVGSRKLTDDHRWVLAKATIRMIYFAEGTWYPGTTKNPYKLRFTYTTFESYANHPFFAKEPTPCGYIPSLGKRECSAASGAGQWMPDTIRGLWNRHEFWYKDKPLFGPENQDLAMLYKLKEIGAWNTLLKGVSFDKDGTFKVDRDVLYEVMFKCAGTWAGLPKAYGDTLGAHNQGARSGGKLEKLFYQQFGKLKREWGIK